MVLDKFLHDKRLKELNRHLFWKAALVNLKLRPYDDNGTSRIVYTFPEKILTETPGLTFQHIGQRFKRPVSRPGNRTAAAAVVNQRINCLLQHPFFISYDNVRRSQFKEPLQTVVSIDNSSVQVVEV